MCGIFGVSVHSRLAADTVQRTVFDLERLLLASSIRGQDASGVAAWVGEEITVLKGGLKAPSLLKTLDFKRFKKKLLQTDLHIFMGHTRLATNGSPFISQNNQPVICSEIVGVHNGIITNDVELWRQFGGQRSKPESDSVTFFQLVNTLFSQTGNLKLAVSRLLAEVEGSASVAILAKDTGEMILGTNTGSLYYTVDAQQNTWFASQPDFFHTLESLRRIRKNVVKQLLPGEFLAFSVPVKLQSAGEDSSSTPCVQEWIVGPQFRSNPSETLNSVSKLRRHTIDFQKIARIRRCTRCILPETTPFISFNDEGVCSYCEQYQPIVYQGEDALEKIFAKYRKKTGKPDCIVAFSGGRDSSYGLHLLKKKYGMHPVAFTYDWGMISDIGRRNQARLVGKLGVEHVVVAADLHQKRAHIRQNIQAWMHRPQLGMIPLFMQGDKHCEYHVDQLKKKYDVNLVIFCRGNSLEKEEFKAGHAGVRHADPGGVIHHLPWLEKARLAFSYGKEYLLNPRYLNDSLAQTLAAYAVTYLIPHDYLYLWHYLPWDETQIIKTLKHEYQWEVSPETSATWRIDDASPAFYNYIYLKVQGFTENDSFRSNQIREGLLSRSEALKLVRYENEPRYEAMKWYFEKLEIDGSKVLEVIDTMPALYHA